MHIILHKNGNELHQTTNLAKTWQRRRFNLCYANMYCAIFFVPFMSHDIAVYIFRLNNCVDVHTFSLFTLSLTIYPLLHFYGYHMNVRSGILLCYYFTSDDKNPIFAVEHFLSVMWLWQIFIWAWRIYCDMMWWIVCTIKKSFIIFLIVEVLVYLTLRNSLFNPFITWRLNTNYKNDLRKSHVDELQNCCSIHLLVLGKIIQLALCSP